MNSHSKYKNLRLFKVFQIQNDYKKHKDRLLQIRTGALPTSHNPTKQKHNHHLTIDTFKRHKQLAQLSKAKERDSRIEHENILIHENLKKVYLRKNFIRSMSRESLRSLRSETAERSLVRLRNRSIEEENVRLHRKLESTRSTISRDRLIEGYSSNRPIRDRITTKTNKKKEELRKIMQRKFNLDPVVVLPKVRTATNSPQNKFKAIS